MPRKTDEEIKQAIANLVAGYKKLYDEGNSFGAEVLRQWATMGFWTLGESALQIDVALEEFPIGLPNDYEQALTAQRKSAEEILASGLLS